MATYIQWDPSYSVHVQVLDNQHQAFIRTLNDLYQSILDQKVKEQKFEIFKKLENYAQIHFATEEGYFDQFNYEGSKEHKDAHNEFRQKILSYKQKIESEEIDFSFELIDFLENWLVNHLDSMDKKYVDCFTKNGLK